MKLHFVLTSTHFSGGRLVLVRHADALARRGHDVSLWVQQPAARLNWFPTALPLRPLPDAIARKLPGADLCLFDRVRLAPLLLAARKGITVHLCQGFEGTDIEERISQIRQEQGLLRGFAQLWPAWRRRREILNAYALPTVKIVVAPHLGEIITRRFGQPCWLVPNGLPEGVFTPPDRRTFTGRTILVVGPIDIACKRILDALLAVRLLKATRPGVRLVRVCQTPMTAEEHQLGVTDVYHTMLTPVQMAEQYRRADVLIMPSSPMEGFGLPALEAMASGLPCVLTDIPALRAFSAERDHAHFVPVGRPDLLAITLGRLLEDAAERERLGRRGIEVAAGYTLQRSHDRMEQTLRQVVEGVAVPRLAG